MIVKNDATTANINVESLVNEVTAERLNALVPTAPETMPTYTESNIVSDSGLMVVRRRPTAFINDVEHAGQAHIAYEVIDNSFDETSLMGPAGQLTVTMVMDQDAGKYALIVEDNGRGIPRGSLVSVFTVPHTSGKYDTSAYKTSAGLFGVGGKAAAGLSEDFRAITKRPEGSASIRVHKAQHNDFADTDPAPCPITGVTVIMTPDPEIFSGIETFAVVGYNILLDRMRKCCFFANTGMRYQIVGGALPPEIWTAPIPETLRIIQELQSRAGVVFDSQTFDRDAWIRSYFRVTRAFNWSMQLTGEGADVNNNHVGFDVRMYYAPRTEGGGRFGMINNVPIDAPTSNHFSVLLKELAQTLAQRIEDEAVAKFFVTQYKLPINIAVDVKYQGAEFTGTTKHAFYSVEFRDAYGPMLAVRLAEEQSVAALDQLYELIREDIESAYMASVTGTAKQLNLKRLDQQLKWPERFFDCDPPGGNRAGTELFVVEGGSAGGGKGRDVATQGIYAMGGKPYNGVELITDPTDLREASRAIQNTPVYRDMLRIINFNPQKPDLSTLNYERMIIMTDADSHGRHIAALLIGNFAVIAPQLVENGYFHVVAPPYFELTYGGAMRKGTEKPRVYLRNAHDVGTWMAKVVYKIGIDIHVTAHDATSAPRLLTQDEFEGFAKMVLNVGEKIHRVAESYRQPPMIIEALTHVTQYLEPGNVNPQKINEVLGFDDVFYEENGHILTLVLGKDDYILPLHNVRERLYAEVMPDLHRMAWRKLGFYVTTRNTDLYKQTPMTITQIYDMMREMDKMFNVRIFKGLGNMEPPDKYTTCMDPRYRTTHVVRSLGDIDRIYRLLGADSAPRKDLISARTIMA